MESWIVYVWSTFLAIALALGFFPMLRAILASLAFEQIRRTYSYAKNVLPFVHRLMGFDQRSSDKSLQSFSLQGSVDTAASRPVFSSCMCEVPGLPAIPMITKLSNKVIRVVAGNPGKFTLHGTNTYLVGSGQSRILVDTGEGLGEYNHALLEAMNLHGCQEIEAILCTHRHYDHIGGIKSLYRIFGRTIPTFKCMRESGTHWDSYQYNSHVPKDIPWQPIQNNQKFTTEGATLTAIFTPGHSEDHVCFMMDGNEFLFTGDNVLGHGTSWFEDLHDYMTSLQLMLKLCSPGIKLLPGHGPEIDEAREKIEEYIHHRELRETQILEAIQRTKRAGLTSLQITLQIYPDVPTQVFFAAHANVRNHLRRLFVLGKVRRMYLEIWVATEEVES